MLGYNFIIEHNGVVTFVPTYNKCLDIKVKLYLKLYLIDHFFYLKV